MAERSCRPAGSAATDHLLLPCVSTRDGSLHRDPAESCGDARRPSRADHLLASRPGSDHLDLLSRARVRTLCACIVHRRDRVLTASAIDLLRASLPLRGTDRGAAVSLSGAVPCRAHASVRAPLAGVLYAVRRHWRHAEHVPPALVRGDALPRSLVQHTSRSPTRTGGCVRAGGAGGRALREEPDRLRHVQRVHVRAVELRARDRLAPAPPRRRRSGFTTADCHRSRR